MKIFLLAALTLLSLVAHAQPDRATKIYNENAAADERRLQKLKDEGRTPNAPSSGGIQAPVDGSFLLGEKYRRNVQAAEKEKQLKAEQKAYQDDLDKQIAEDVRLWGAEQKRLKATWEQFDAEHSEKLRQKMVVLTPLIAPYKDAGFADHDLVHLGLVVEALSAQPEPEAQQRLEQARLAGLALKTQLAQPGGDYAALRELVGREWGRTRYSAFGCHTAIRDYTELERRFPAQTAALEADLTQVSLAMVERGIGIETRISLGQGRNNLDSDNEFFTDGLVELHKHFAGNAAMARPVLLACLRSEGYSVMKPSSVKIYKALFAGKDETNYRLQAELALPMVYAVCQTELLQQPADPKLAQWLVRSAEGLLYLFPDAPIAARIDWMMQRLDKLHDASRMPTNVDKAPEILAALTDAQAQQVSTELGIALGDQNTRARLARLLPSLKAVPDNPDWQALRADGPLAKTVQQLIYKHGSDRKWLLLGTWTACTVPGAAGQEKAMSYWNFARQSELQDSAGISTVPVMRTAVRNMYRALLLDQSGNFRTQSYNDPLKKKDAAGWLDETKERGPECRYNEALILLDQSPDFPPIGIVDKKKARELLKNLAEKGYEPAKAKLKEL